MKFINTKTKMIINGLLTLTGLAMLFSGLIIQMNEASDFDAGQRLATAGPTLALIIVSVMMVIGFGMAFFNSWAIMNNHHAKHVVKAV